jgi:hypothetical protein
MLKFQGYGDTTKVNIRIYGDGVSREIFINLAKPPFDLAFKGFYPKNVLTANIKEGAVKSVTLQNDTLNVMFADPPAAADLNTPEGQPFTSFSVEFVYGTDITTAEAKEQP